MEHIEPVGHFLIRLSENGYLDNRYAPENFEHMAEKISLRYVEIRGLFGFRCTSMYTKVTPKAGQNGPMSLYVGCGATILPVWLGKSYNYFSMMVVGYMGKLQARFVLRRSPFRVISRPCRT